MKIELIKSYILAILVLISLLLTFSLWNYKPSYEHTFDKDYVDEINLGGSVQAKEDIVQPESIIFKRNNESFGFSDPKDDQAFYKEMQTWTLYDFEVSETSRPPKNTMQVELIFPDAMPLDILSSIFDLDKEEELGDWSFERVYLTFNKGNSTLTVHILSTDGRKHAEAIMTNATKYDYVQNYMESLEGMSEYITLDESEQPIYMRKNAVTLPRLSATIDTIDPLKLVNALFSDPSAVRRNVVDEEMLYTDGQRQMRVFYNRRLMEFVNPYQSYERMSPDTLLEESIANINEYDGWTDRYVLDSIDLIHNRITYQMYYDSYPVFSKSGLATIEQEWHDQEIVRYKRPLFSIKDTLGDEEVELPSGTTVMKYLQTNANYEIEKVNNVKIGYRLSFQDTGFYTLSLDPVWYVEYHGHWQELDMRDATHKGEVS